MRAQLLGLDAAVPGADSGRPASGPPRVLRIRPKARSQPKASPAVITAPHRGRTRSRTEALRSLSPFLPASPLPLRAKLDRDRQIIGFPGQTRRFCHVSVRFGRHQEGAGRQNRTVARAPSHRPASCGSRTEGQRTRKSPLPQVAAHCDTYSSPTAMSPLFAAMACSTKKRSDSKNSAFLVTGSASHAVPNEAAWGLTTLTDRSLPSLHHDSINHQYAKFCQFLPTSSSNRSTDTALHWVSAACESKSQHLRLHQ